MHTKLGIDIVYIPRFEKSMKNKSFINRVFNKSEISKKYNPEHLAGIFADSGGLALFLLAYLFWNILDLRNDRPGVTDSAPAPAGIRGLALVTTATLCLQIVYGAFTAGLHAGWGYNTFPGMNGQWIADAVGTLTPFWLNFLESTATIQFIHRWLGTLLLALIIWLWSSMFRRQLDEKQRLSLHLLLLAVCGQYIMGVYTLVEVVPLVPAAMHQAGACLVLLAAVNVNFRFRRNRVMQGNQAYR